MRSRGRLGVVAAVWCALSIASLGTVAAGPAAAAEGERDVYPFGSAADVGDTGSLSLVAPLAGMAPTPSGNGYWLVAADGGVFAYGDAVFRGSAASLPLAAPIVGIAATPSGNGYWLVGGDGGVFAYGDAVFRGSAASLPLVDPIVGIEATPSGNGYWLVAGDGGVFAYGDAVFRGSAAGLPLVAPIVGIEATPSGNGYWSVAGDGGVFAYGDAVFRGSAAGLPLAEPITGMARTPTGGGYWLAARDGGVFTYGAAPFLGATSNLEFVPGFVAIAAAPGGGGYWLLADGTPHGLFPGIWPQTTEAQAAADTGHLDPVAVAAEFMEVYVGVPDAAGGSFVPLGPGVGAVPVEPVGGGPITTVLLRSLTGTGPGPWSVTASQAAEIFVDVPAPLSAVGPLAVLMGRGRAFEGHINVEVRQDGQVAAGAPLGEGFVTGGGTDILPFSGALPFTTPTEDAGAVLFLTYSAKDGSAQEATTVRVALPNPPFFPGGLTLLPDGTIAGLSTFNGFVASARPAWAGEQVTTAFFFALGQPMELPQRFEITQPSPSTVEVTLWGFADDSVEAGRSRINLTEQANGTWRATSATWSQKCWPGRGHQDFSTVPCI